MNHLEDTLLFQIRAANLPIPEREYRFAARAVGLGKGVRERLKVANLQDWRFDFAWPNIRLAAEIEGGTWSKGRHVRGVGFENDCRKYNAAALMGWAVLRFTGGMIESGAALESLEQWLAATE